MDEQDLIDLLRPMATAVVSCPEPDETPTLHGLSCKTCGGSAMAPDSRFEAIRGGYPYRDYLPWMIDTSLHAMVSALKAFAGYGQIDISFEGDPPSYFVQVWGSNLEGVAFGGGDDERTAMAYALKDAWEKA